MPVDDLSGQLRAFTNQEVNDMNIRTAGVRDQSHGAETRELDQSTMRKSFFVAWESRFDFCELCIGTEKLWDDGGKTRLSRLIPDAQYGRHTDPYRDNIVATKIESIKGANGAGVDDIDGNVEYPDARIDVFYELVKYEQAADGSVYTSTSGVADSEVERYVYYDGADGDVEVYSMPGGGMHYIVEGGTAAGVPEPHLRPLPFNVNINRPLEKFSYVWERLPEAAFAATSNLFRRIYTGEGSEGSYMGRINSVKFFGREVGTVMFLGVKPELLLSQTGDGKRWRLKYNFLFAPSGHTWLRYFDPTGARSDYYFVGNGSVHHTADSLPDNYSIVTGAADLNNLFNVDTV